VVLFVFIAFRTAWPAFAYSIEDDDEARRTYGFVLTYLLLVCCWISLALGLLAPWLVRLLSAKPELYPASRVVSPLAFGTAAYALMFVGMTLNAQRVYPVPYQWRRVTTLVAAAVGLTVLGKLVHASLPVALALSAVYPLVLLPLGFYLRSELRPLRRVLPASR